jgi:hypothetical protein
MTTIASLLTNRSMRLLALYKHTDSQVIRASSLTPKKLLIYLTNALRINEKGGYYSHIHAVTLSAHEESLGQQQSQEKLEFCRRSCARLSDKSYGLQRAKSAIKRCLKIPLIQL